MCKSRLFLVALSILALQLAASPWTADAQVVRPGDERPELKEFEAEEEPESSLRLPPIPRVPPDRRDRLSSGARVFVKAYRVVGSTVFSEEELAAVTAPFTGREISSAELIEARDAITRHYIEQGYISSGAVIPDKRVEDGVIELRVVEGTLAGVSVEGTERFRRGYFEKRLERAAGKPLNIHGLERRLQIFQQDQRIRRVNAELGPGEVRGESFLSLAVEEDSPYRAWTSLGNEESPSIGSEHGEIRVQHLNLLGTGDELSGSFGMTEGLDEWDVSYSLPINSADTTLRFRFQQSDSEVVEDPFSDLDIESKSRTYGIGLRHPLYRTATTELWLGLVGELRRSETELLGRPFSFSLGSDNGDTKLSVLRFQQEWTSRTRSRVLAARSLFSFGLDVLDATDERVSGARVRVPDGQFFTWLGQFQWAQRLPHQYRGSQLIVRTDVQLTNGPLLSLEQLAIGGMRTVRGYRENQMVRDNGVIASVELRIPVLRTSLGADILQIAPFADFGHAWNDQKSPAIKTLSSLGVGLRYLPSDRVFFEAYWGGALRSVEERGTNLQNHGVHFRASIRGF